MPAYAASVNAQAVRQRVIRVGAGAEQQALIRRRPTGGKEQRRAAAAAHGVVERSRPARCVTSLVTTCS